MPVSDIMHEIEHQKYYNCLMTEDRDHHVSQTADTTEGSVVILTGRSTGTTPQTTLRFSGQSSHLARYPKNPAFAEWICLLIVHLQLVIWSHIILMSCLILY